MVQSIVPDAQSLEDAFFRKRDAQLIAEMRRREAQLTRKKMLTDVSGITDENVLDQLVAHDIHAETLAAFSLIPVIEAAWADGEVQPAERKILIHAIQEMGIPGESVAYKLFEQWLEIRPQPTLMKVWANYTKVLMSQLTPDVRERLKQTVLEHARAVAEAGGGFLGLGRISSQEEKVLKALEAAFQVSGA